MILPKVRDPRFVTIRRGGTLTDSITISSPSGRHLAQSTSLTSLSRNSPRTHDHVRRSSMPAPGCVARSR